MRLFILMERAFEYTDEYYRSVEGDPGYIFSTFRDRQKAEEACAEMNLKEYLKPDFLTDHCFDDLVEKVAEDLLQAGLITEKEMESLTDYEPKIDFSRLSEEQKRRLAKIYEDNDLWKFEVIEVEV